MKTKMEDIQNFISENDIRELDEIITYIKTRYPKTYAEVMKKHSKDITF